MALTLPKFLTAARRKPAPEPLPTVLELASGSLPLVIRRNPRAKRMIMRFRPGGGALLVTAPPRIGAKAILDFIERHKGWAEARLVKAGGLLRVADGAVLPFLGGSLTVRHAPGRRASRIEPGGDGDGDGDGARVLHVGGAPQHLARRTMDCLKREARAALQEAVDRHAAAVGLRPSSLTLKDTKSRWGSCTVDRRLAFSWRIVMAPPEVLDYLAAHEVAHFRQMNHGPAFWALCRELCPGMDHGRDWLKRHGAELHKIDFG